MLQLVLFVWPEAILHALFGTHKFEHVSIRVGQAPELGVVEQGERAAGKALRTLRRVRASGREA